MNLGTRSEVKERIRQGAVQVNGVIIKKGDVHIDEKKDTVVYAGKTCTYTRYVYFLMNKPPGVVSATKDDQHRTVLDVFCTEYAKQHGGSLEGVPIKEIFPVGRLDKDTVGLLVLTNDGELAHRVLSPKKHIPKTYYVKTNDSILEEMVVSFHKGIQISEQECCMSADLEIIGDKEAFLTIHEGKFHQVKRMFHKVGLDVIYLKRISMGGLRLPDQMPEGTIRELAMEEVAKLC